MAQEYTEEQAMGAIKNAHAAGDNDAVNQWADYLDNMKGIPVESAPQEQVEPEKEETFGRGFVETKSMVQNLGDLAVAATGFGGTLSYRDEDGYGLGYTSTEERYGEDFGDLSFDERRVRINERDAAEVERQYPNQTGSTFGTITGSITDPSIALPVGQTYKAMTAIGGAYGATYSASSQFMEKGEIDPVELGAMTLGSAVLAPATGYLFAKTGAAITKARLPKRIESANSALDDLDANISHYVALQRSPEEAFNAAAQDLKLTPEKIAQASKLANRKPRIPDPSNSAQMASKHKEANKISRLIEAVSSRAKELSPPVWNVLRTLEQDILKFTQERLNLASPLTKALNVYPDSVKAKITFHLNNRDYKSASALMTKGGQKELKVIQNLMKKDGETFRGMYGEGFQTLVNYFPRKVKDYEGLLKALGRRSPKAASGLEKAVKEALAKENLTSISQLSDNAMTQAVIVATNKAYPKLAGTSLKGSRTVKQVPEELMPFYEDAGSALVSYIESSTRLMEKHKVLGKALGRQAKDGTIDDTAKLWKTIAAETKAGRLTYAAEAELKELIRSRFVKGEEAMGKGYAIVKDLGYMSTLGQFRSALTQLKDLGTSAYLHGTLPTIKAMFKYKSTMVHDAGLVNTVSAEMLNPTSTKKWLDHVLSLSGFRLSDRFGKKVLMEASMMAGKKLASSPKGAVKLKKKYGAAYGDDFEELVTSLKNGVDDKHTELYRFHELSDTQPISLLELPTLFLNHPDGRIAYALKSFGLKQLTLLHNNIIKRAKGGDKLGATKEALKYAAFIGIVGGTVDEVKGVIGGEDFDVTDIPDHVVNNLLGLMFLSKYALGDIGKGDMSGYFGDLLVPPVPALEASLREVSGFQEERKRGDPEFGDDLLKTMPIMGRILHDWVLGGKEKAQRDKDADERKSRLE